MPLGKIVESVPAATPSTQSTSLPDADVVAGAIEPGAWVRERILEEFSTLLTQTVKVGGTWRYGADLDGNGRVEDVECLEDFDGNGVVGNALDFIAYYERNRAAIETRIPFFRWAVMMDWQGLSVYNPIHDYLNISMRMYPEDDIKDAYARIGSIITGARTSLSPWASTEEIVATVSRECARDVRIKGTTRLIADGFLRGRISHDAATYLVLGAAHQLGAEVYTPDEARLTSSDGTTRTMSPASLIAAFYADHARELARRDDVYGARDLYATARTLDPTASAHRHNLARTLIALTQYDEARDALVAARVIDPRDHVAITLMGDTWFHEGNYIAAFVDYYTAAALQPAHAPAHVGLGRTYQALKDYAKARAAYDKAIALDAQNAETYYYRGHLSEDIRQPKRAQQDYRRALRIDSTYAPAYHALAVIHHREGNLKDAETYYTRAIRYDRRNALYHSDVGMLYHQHRKPAEARAAYDKAIDLNPLLAEARLNRAQLRHESKKFTDAIDDLRAGLGSAQDTPTRVRAHLMLGAIYLDLMDRVQAETSYKDVLALDAKNAAAWTGLGIVHRHHKKNEAALRAFNEAVAGDKTHVPAYYQRGLLWQELGQWENAEADFTKATDLDRNSAEALMRRSEVRTKRGDAAGSAQDYALGCKIDPALCAQR